MTEWLVDFLTIYYWLYMGGEVFLLNELQSGWMWMTKKGSYGHTCVASSLHCCGKKRHNPTATLLVHRDVSIGMASFLGFSQILEQNMSKTVLRHLGITFKHLPPEFANRSERKPQFQKPFLRKLQTICQNLSWFLQMKKVWGSVIKAWLWWSMGS